MTMGIVQMLLLSGWDAAAQPLLNFKRIDVQYPVISLAFKVTCGGVFKRDMGPQHFEVRENGILVKDAALWCPPDDSCCISAVLVLDRTGSMGDTKTVKKISRVKTAADAFIDLMDTPCDEAALVSFNQDVTVDVPMTTDKTRLKTAVDAMTAFGTTALWDATAAGIQLVSGQTKNRCKALVLLTDGGENSSRSYIFRDVRVMAAAAGVKVFTIGYGLINGSPEEDSLKVLADITGGKYFFAPLQNDLTTIFTSIKQEIKEAYRECLLSYVTDCPDGTLRTVELTLKDYCGGTVTQTRTYQAPLDRSKFKQIHISLGNQTVAGTQTAVVPVILDTPVKGVLGACDFTIVYDRSITTLTGISTSGTLLENVPVQMTDIGVGNTIFIKKNVPLDTSGGVLMNLTFKAGDVLFDAETRLQINNWNLYAYCLVPSFGEGRLAITPREPILDCSALVPSSLSWDDTKKDYVPNPFTVSVTVHNSGSREARNVRARITLMSSKLRLSSPAVAEQAVSPGIVQPGQEASASWDIRSLKLDNADSMQICFTVLSDNHPAITCCRTMTVAPAQSASLVCALEAPDTVYFREQFYDPEEFDVTLRARNEGSGQTKDVTGQLLQDTRFTIIPPASLHLADVLPPGQDAGGHFRVRMHPRQTDGYDTLRVNVQGNDTDPAWCFKPVWVQRERSPILSLICSTPEDSLVFSDQSYEYTPNPFVVTTIAQNVGETYAEDCQLMFVGPQRFTPVGTNLRQVGVMQVGDTRTAQWTVRALPRTIGGWDTLQFQVLGRGGLGKKIVLADCYLPIYVPAIRRPSYELTCVAPDSLTFTGSGYQPDPFRFTLQVTNTGTAPGRRIGVTIQLQPGVGLAAGESPDRIISELQPGETSTLEWRLTAELRNTDGVVTLCSAVIDSIGATGECCRTIVIPRERHPVLELTCATVDTVFVDASSGAYANNPFSATLTIVNSGTDIARSIRASLVPTGSGVVVLDSSDLWVGDIAPGGIAVRSWRVNALPRENAGPIGLLFQIQADNHAIVQCERQVYIDAIRSPRLGMTCWSQPEDSLFFDWETGDFNPPVFTVHARVSNTGSFRAEGVTALLILPPGVAFAAGETPQRIVGTGALDPQTSAEASWRLSAQRQDADAVRSFRILVRADNASDVDCVDPLFVQGAPKHLTLALPDNLLFRYGEKGTIPLTISKTIGRDLTSYIVDIEYDPTVVDILHATNLGTLTERGWVGPTLQQTAPGRVRIADYTTSVPLHVDSGSLVSFYIEGIYQGTRFGGDFRRSPLHIDPATVLLNFGEIRASTIDGGITVTSDCLEPLTSTASVQLGQNSPNPFNGETRIDFYMPFPGRAKLVVVDRMGRMLDVLVDGELDAGRHVVRFANEQLQSGVYFYRLETPGAIEVRKMIIAR